ARTYRVRAESRRHCALFEVDDLRGERARAEREREVVGGVLREVPLGLAGVGYLRLDEGRALHLAVEDDGHVRADVRCRPRAELLRARGLQGEADAVALIAPRRAGGHRFGAAKFAAADDSRLLDNYPRLRLARLGRRGLPGGGRFPLAV